MREVKYKKTILHVNSGIDNPNIHKIGNYYCLKNVPYIKKYFVVTYLKFLGYFRVF